MQALPQLNRQSFELCLPSLAHRLPQHHEFPLSRPRTRVREAEEIKRLGLPVAARSSISVRIPTEFDQARLVGMQRQTETRQSLAQISQKLLGLRAMLKPHDEVVGEAHDDDVAARPRLPPSLGPQVIHIVEVDIRQERTDAPALDGPHLPRCPLPILQHTGAQPFLDEAHDAPVSDAMLDEPNQPLVVEGVKEAPNVGVEHPVHLSPVDPDRERIHRQMRIASRPETVRKPEKRRLVDRVQHLDDGALDNLVFQRGDTERPLPPVRLRDVDASYGVYWYAPRRSRSASDWRFVSTCSP